MDKPKQTRDLTSYIERELEAGVPLGWKVLRVSAHGPGWTIVPVVVPKGRSHPYYELFVTGDLKHIVITYGNKVSDSVMPMIDAKVIATSDLHHLSLKTVISHIMHVCEPNEGPEHQRVGNVIRIGNTICEIQDDAV